jgi:hypothetical protein
MKGVSSLLAMALVILLSVSTTILVLNFAQPSLNRMKDSKVIDEAQMNLETLHTAIKEVASEARDSKRTVTLTITDGYYKMNETIDWIYFDYDLLSDLVLGGQKGNLNITQSSNSLRFFIPYQNVDLKGTATFSTGTIKVVITKEGTNTTLNKPIVRITTV